MQGTYRKIQSNTIHDIHDLFVQMHKISDAS